MLQTIREASSGAKPEPSDGTPANKRLKPDELERVVTPEGDSQQVEIDHVVDPETRAREAPSWRRRRRTTGARARFLFTRVARRAMGGEEASRGGGAGEMKRVAGSSERARAAV